MTMTATDLEKVRCFCIWLMITDDANMGVAGRALPQVWGQYVCVGGVGEGHVGGI